MAAPIIAIEVDLKVADLATIPAMMREAAKPVLMKFAAFVWQRARTSIKPSKAISAPGSPPNTHNKTLPASIRFAFDDATESVVIGPVPLPGKSGTAATALEVGGSTRMLSRRRGIQVVRIGAVKARPFMGPALVAETPNLPPLWQNSLKG